MTTPRDDHTATLLLNGMVLMCGGSGSCNVESGSCATLSSAELYF
jgi:hypothetical protein